MLTKVEMGGAMDNRAFKTPVLTAKRIWECEQCVKKNTYTSTIWTTLRIDSVCNTDKCKTQIEIYLQFDVDSSAYMGMGQWTSA